ncbi:hypothetical protein Tco_0626975 [Tanacetum coccineum]|uniref:Uncharacterized protein n=1 Tax=Tanacetum coccineum TaxID=301880 RepID=A0ABQ4WL88_9ASTR
MFSERGDGVARIKQRRHDLSGDGVWILAKASQRRRLKVDLEPSTYRRRQKHQATPSHRYAYIYKTVIGVLDEALERNDDNIMFDTRVFDEEEVEVEKVVSTAEVTTASATTTVDELTLAQTLIEIKAAKPKAVTTATTTAVTRPKARGVVVKEPKLQAELEEEERLARQKEEEDNLISWDNTQAMFGADYVLAQMIQVEELGELHLKKDQTICMSSWTMERKRSTLCKLSVDSLLFLWYQEVMEDVKDRQKKVLREQEKILESDNLKKKR